MPDELAYRLELRLPAGWTEWSHQDGPDGPNTGPRAAGRRTFAWIGDPPGRAVLAFATVDLVPRPVELRGSSARDAALVVLRDLGDAERWRPRDPALSVLRRDVRECSLEGAAIPPGEPPAAGSPSGGEEAATDGARDPAVLVDEWIAVGERERRLVEHRVVVLRFPAAAAESRFDEAPYALRASAVTKQMLTDPPLVDVVRAIAAAARIEVAA